MGAKFIAPPPPTHTHGCEAPSQHLPEQLMRERCMVQCTHSESNHAVILPLSLSSHHSSAIIAQFTPFFYHYRSVYASHFIEYPRSHQPLLSPSSHHYFLNISQFSPFFCYYRPFHIIFSHNHSFVITLSTLFYHYHPE